MEYPYHKIGLMCRDPLMVSLLQTSFEANEYKSNYHLIHIADDDALNAHYDLDILLLDEATSPPDRDDGIIKPPMLYIEKPVKFIQLIAQLTTRIKQSTNALDHPFALGALEIDPAKRVMLLDQNHSKPLTDKELLLLQHLYRHAGRPIDRLELLKRLWHYHNESESHTLETHIYRLRQKLDGLKANVGFTITAKHGTYQLDLISLT